MAKIENSNAITSVIHDLKLNPGVEKTPDTLSNVVIPTYPLNVWKQIQIAELTQNTSAKTITVPRGKCWKLIGGNIGLVTTGTAGNRQMFIQFRRTSPNTIAYFRNMATSTQAASLTYLYNLNPAIQGGIVNNTQQLNINKEIELRYGDEIYIADISGIDSAADDMNVYLTILEKDSLSTSN